MKGDDPPQRCDAFPRNETYRRKKRKEWEIMYFVEKK